jgi:hypothetical protein
MREKVGMDSPATRSAASSAGRSDQCMELEGRGLHSNGGAAEELVIGMYEGASSDDATLGIPSGLLAQQIPDMGI